MEVTVFSRVLPAALAATTLLVAAPASAKVPKVAGDIALMYGRNLAQGLNVGGFAFEVKGNVHPQISVGVRPFFEIGAGGSATEDGAEANAFGAVGATAKGEFFLTESKVRPYGALGLGVASINGAGALAAADDDSAEASSWTASGIAPVIYPEVGLDLAKFRVALLYRAPIGAKGEGAVASVNDQGETTESIEDGPSLGGILLQIGLHFGGPK